MNTEASIIQLQLKDRLEEKVACLGVYEPLDDPEYPGWTFLLNDVVKNYGICPYLDVSDEECKVKRRRWIAEQKDEGKVYFEIVKKVVKKDWISEIECEVDVLRNHITDYVKNVLVELQEDMKLTRDEEYEKFENDKPITVDHDTLIETIRMRKEAKSQNKKIKEAWNELMRTLDYIMVKKGFDFSKYAHVAYNYVLRYKSPSLSEDVALDSKFEAMYNSYMSLVSKLNNARLFVEREKNDAEQHLVSLIMNKFHLEQKGKYYKKWSSLTDEKKHERIQSYCAWFVRKNGKAMSISEHMARFIMEKLNSKDLRIMDVKWDIKLGIVTHVNIVVNDDNTFELGKRAPRILKSPRKTSKKKRDEMFKNTLEKSLLQKINRLLLFEMVKGQTLKKELVVESVLNNLHTRLIPHNQVADYIIARYDEVLDVLTNNPL